MIYELLKTKVELSRLQIDQLTGFDKSKSIRVLNRLIEKSIIRKIGTGASVIYKLK